MNPWIAASSGGVLIGIAATLLLVIVGRVAGISGIAGGALSRHCPDRPWRIAFLLGLPLGGLLCELAVGHTIHVESTVSTPLVAIAGVLVGFGTQLGNGCTSGHGVCGVARGSPRSIVATAVFMVTGMLVVFVMRHMLGA